MNTYINTSSTSNTTALPTGDYLMVDLSVKNARIPPQVKSIIERYALTTTAGSLCRATLQAEFTGNYIMLDITTNDDAWGKIKERVRRFRKDNNIKIPVAVPVPEALFKDPNEPPLDYNRDEERGSSEEDDIALGKRIRFMRNPQDKFPIKLPRCASMLDPFAYDGLTSFVGRHFAEDEYRPELFFEMKNGKVHPLKDAGKKRDRKRSLKKKARVGAHSDMEVEPHKPTFKWNHQNAAVVFTQQYKFVERHSARQAKDIRDHVLQAGDWCEDQKILMQHYINQTAEIRLELKDKTGFEDVRSLTCARSAARRLKMAEDEIEDLKSQLHVREHDLRVAEIKRDESRANCNFSENLLKIKENTIDSSNAIIKQLIEEKEMANKRLYCTKNALNTINARNTLMTAVFEPTVSTQYWTKDSREKSAMYFNWRLISNPVLFYNEMVAYYEATQSFTDINEVQQYEIIIDIGMILRSIHSGRYSMKKANSTIAYVANMPRIATHSEQYPLALTHGMKTGYLFAYLGMVMPLPESIAFWVENQLIDPSVPQPRMYMLKFMKHYLLQVQGECSDQKIIGLIQDPQYDDFSLAERLPGGFPAGDCYSMGVRQSQFDWFEAGSNAQLIHDLQIDVSCAHTQIHDMGESMIQARNELAAQKTLNEQIQTYQEALEHENNKITNELTKYEKERPLEYAFRFDYAYTSEPTECIMGCGHEDADYKYPVNTPYFNVCCMRSGSNFACIPCFTSWAMGHGTCCICRKDLPTGNVREEPVRVAVPILFIDEE